MGAEGAPVGVIEQDKVVGKQVVAESEDEGVVTVADELAALELAEQADKEQESRAKKRRARRRKAKESARALRRSLRLQEKEEPGFELPEAKAARVQEAKFDFSGMSRRLRNALSRSYLASADPSSSDDNENLRDIAVACGATEEEAAEIDGEAAGPSAST
jgi:hypothetical protein